MTSLLSYPELYEISSYLNKSSKVTFSNLGQMGTQIVKCLKIIKLTNTFQSWILPRINILLSRVLAES